jgi:hypothetical protein
VQLSWNPYEVYESQTGVKTCVGENGRIFYRAKYVSANYIVGAICKDANSFLKTYLEVSKHSEKLHVYK